MDNQSRKANRNRPPLTAGVPADTFHLTIGGLAQLGERLAGSQKVSGSSPLSSTFFGFIMLETKPQFDGAFSFAAVASAMLHGRPVNCHNRQTTAPIRGNLA